MTVLDWLDQIQPQDRFIVGDKAFYLGQLLQRGYPVVPGFVVRSSTLRDFLAAIDWLEPLFADLSDSALHLDVNNPRQLQAIAQRIRASIQTSPLPSDWLTLLSAAVEQLTPESGICPIILRPSLALRFPQGLLRKARYRLPTSGLWQSHVCWSDAAALEQSLKKAWAELFRARSLLYWQRCGIKLHQIHLGVLVQPIRPAKASGILQATSDTFEIKATWGLGMPIVTGEVIPDAYQVNAETGQLQVHHPGEKTVFYDLVANSQTETPRNLLPNANVTQPLQIQVLSESLMAETVLSDRELQQLVSLAQHIKTELTPSYILEWTFLNSSHVYSASQGELYLTQATVQSSTQTQGLTQAASEFRVPTDSLEQETLAYFPLLNGLAAAPGQSQALATVITQTSISPESILPGRILVVSAIAPDYLPLLQQATGIIAEQGGLTSHGAIVARELGIPAIVSAVGATRLIQTGDAVLMDGSTGSIYRVDPQTATSTPKSPTLWVPTPRPYRTITQLLVNLSQSASIHRAKDFPVEGIGLLRSELMLPEVLKGESPWEWLQQGRSAEFVERWQQQICLFAAAFAPRPVFYRSLDLALTPDGDLSQGSSLHAAATSVLGLRGTFNYVLNPTLFDLELRAIAQVHQLGYRNVHLILPFVRTVEEFVFCRDRLPKAGLNPKQIQLWIMAEVPSVLFLLPEYVKAGVQGISIGTNDLTQLLLGIDRNLGILAAAFDKLHPAVLGAIKQLVEMANDCGIPCSICGQAPSLYPELIDDLVQWGITSISVDLSAVESTLEAIAMAEQRILLEAARRQLRQQ